ncbi:MAG: endospore germination permease [Clostridiales bacterium]|nr:endospore germination permease [Clostridiales bacterium]
MRLDKERISESQLLFAFTCFMQATMLRLVFVSSITGIDSWAMAFTGALAHLPMLLINVTLLKWFPGKGLFEINDELFGPVFGRVFSAVYLYFFLTLAGLNSMDASNFVVDFMMPGTPLVLVLVLFLLACAYAVRKGLESYMRLSALLAVGAIAIVLFNFVLVLQDTNLSYLFPMFRQPVLKYVQGTHITATIPYGESVVFMMIAPALGREKSPGRPLVLGLALSSLFMAGIIFRDVICLGPLINYVSLPSFEAVRMINVADIITRIESLYAILNVSLLFFKVCILLFACTRGLAQMTRLTQYKHLALAMAAFACVYSLTIYDSMIKHAYSGSFSAPFLWLLFEYIMPCIALLAALIRRRRARRAEAGA